MIIMVTDNGYSSNLLIKYPASFTAVNSGASLFSPVSRDAIILTAISSTLSFSGLFTNVKADIGTECSSPSLFSTKAVLYLVSPTP